MKLFEFIFSQPSETAKAQDLELERELRAQIEEGISGRGPKNRRRLELECPLSTKISENYSTIIFSVSGR